MDPGLPPRRLEDRHAAPLRVKQKGRAAAPERTTRHGSPLTIAEQAYLSKSAPGRISGLGTRNGRVIAKVSANGADTHSSRNLLSRATG